MVDGPEAILSAMIPWQRPPPATFGTTCWTTARRCGTLASSTNAATKEKPMDILHKFMKGVPDEFGQQIGVARLRTVSERSYPGWNLAIPDVLRADRFIKRLHELEAANKMADLTIVYLPQDHTSGGEASFPTPRAQVADNDLGVGRVLEALSHSKVWKDTVVFVEEDDPQDGFDHVDGHRRSALVAGPMCATAWSCLGSITRRRWSIRWSRFWACPR